MTLSQKAQLIGDEHLIELGFKPDTFFNLQFKDNAMVTHQINTSVNESLGVAQTRCSCGWSNFNR